jgi:hypothetical protein
VGKRRTGEVVSSRRNANSKPSENNAHSKELAMMNNFEAFQKQGQENLELTMKSVNAVTRGFQDIAKEAADYSKSQFEKSTAAAEKLMASKSIEKAVEVQADYAKTAYESFIAQATKMGELYVDLAKEVYKPLENIMPKAAK